MCSFLNKLLWRGLTVIGSDWGGRTGKQVRFQVLQEPETTVRHKGRTGRPAAPTAEQYLVSGEKGLSGCTEFLQFKSPWPAMMTHYLHKPINQGCLGTLKGKHFGFPPKSWLEWERVQEPMQQWLPDQQCFISLWGGGFWFCWCQMTWIFGSPFNLRSLKWG